MNKIRLSRLAALLLFTLCLGGVTAKAQQNLILGPRLIVESPSSIAGVKDFTYSSNPAASAPWGGALPLISNTEIVKASDTEACGAISNLAGKWVLIYRGNCEFGVKALNAQQAGAAGVIIWNHTNTGWVSAPHDLINMGAGAQGGNVNIPVLFISNTDGRSITNQLSNGQQVFIAISQWGFNKANDLAFVAGSAAAPPGKAVPITQFVGSNNYMGYTAALVANTGSSNATNVQVKSTVTFTPTGGSAVPFFEDSVIVTAFSVTDSLSIVSSDNSFKFTPNNIGRYDFKYDLSSDSVDEYTIDNSLNVSLDVTYNMFCRGRIDPVKQQPIVTGYSRVSGTTEFTWGPMFYNQKGGYQLESVQFSLADNDTSFQHTMDVSPGGTSIEAYVYKWVDANNDGYMQGGEVTLKGIARKDFTSSDTVKRMYTANIGDAAGNPAQILSEDSSYYWIAFGLGTVFTLGVDDATNYYSREFAAFHGTNPSHDFWAPAILKNRLDIIATDTIRAIPYGVTDQFSGIIDSATYNQQYSIPAVVLRTSIFPLSVNNLSTTADDKFTIYPNPAVSEITADISFASQKKNADLKIIDALGRQVYFQRLSGAKSDKVSISLDNIVPGSYYMIVGFENKALFKQFTIQGK